MRFLHTADWHIGKKLHGYDLIEDQKYILTQIKKTAKEKKVDAIVIAGDLYDRAVPSVEAIDLFNDTIIDLNLTEKFPILAISGNHDSSVRLQTGQPWFEQSSFHLHTRLEQAFTPIEHLKTQFFLLPYFEPIDARIYFENDQIKTIEQAMIYVIDELKKQFKSGFSKVLVSHFFVSGSEKTDSETKLTVGGLEGIPSDLLEAFDYVALGHLHNKDALKMKNATYSGSPLKFSLSEMNQEKGVWLVDIEGSQVNNQFIPLKPLREMRQVQGSFEELTRETDKTVEDFVHIQLTDRAVISNMMNQLRQLYPWILGIERLHGRNEKINKKQVETLEELSPELLIHQFYREMTDEAFTEKQEMWMKEQLEILHRKGQEQ